MHPSRLAKLGPAADPSKFSIPSAAQVRTVAPASVAAPPPKQNVQLTAPRTFDAPPPGVGSQSWSLGRGRGSAPPPSRKPSAPSRSFGRGGPPSRGPPAPFRGPASFPAGPPPSSFTRPSGPPPESVVKSAAGIHPDRLKMLGIKAPPATTPSRPPPPQQQQAPQSWNSTSASYSAQGPASQPSGPSDWRPSGLGTPSHNNGASVAASNNGQLSNQRPGSQSGPNPAFNATHPPPNSSRPAPASNQGFSSTSSFSTQSFHQPTNNAPAAMSQSQQLPKQQPLSQSFGGSSSSINGSRPAATSDARPASSNWGSQPAPSSSPTSRPSQPARSQEPAAAQKRAGYGWDVTPASSSNGGWDSPPPQPSPPTPVTNRPASQTSIRQEQQAPLQTPVASKPAPSPAASKPAPAPAANSSWDSLAREASSKAPAASPPVPKPTADPSWDSPTKASNSGLTLSFETSSAAVLPTDPKPQPTISFASSSASILPKQKDSEPKNAGSSLKITAIFDSTEVVERRVIIEKEAPPAPSSLSLLFTTAEKQADEKESSWDNQAAFDWDASRPPSAKASAAAKPAEKPVLTTRWSKVIDQHTGWSAPPPPPSAQKPVPKPQPRAPVDRWNSGPQPARAAPAEHDDGGWSSSSSSVSPPTRPADPPRSEMPPASVPKPAAPAQQPLPASQAPAQRSSTPSVNTAKSNGSAAKPSNLSATLPSNGRSAPASTTNGRSGWGTASFSSPSTTQAARPAPASNSRFQQQLRESFQLQVASSGGWSSDDEDPSEIVAQLQSVRKTAYGISSPV